MPRKHAAQIGAGLHAYKDARRSAGLSDGTIKIELAALKRAFHVNEADLTEALAKVHLSYNRAIDFRGHRS